MTSPLLGGSLGGLLSAVLAQALTTLVDRALGSEAWLQGPHGPPFFNIALFMGLLYGGIALGLSRRRDDVMVGACGPALGIALPMAVLTRLPLKERWLPVVVFLFVASIWGTIFALGRRLTQRWSGGAAACGGAFAGYLLMQAVTALAPGLSQWRPQSYWPAPVVLLDGLFTGAGIGLAVHLMRRKYGEAARA